MCASHTVATKLEGAVMNLVPRFVQASLHEKMPKASAGK